MASDLLALSTETIKSKIHTIRDMQVMIDSDLAELYNVETRALNQAVKRNIKRFPRDFMFQLTDSEAELLVSQNVIPSKQHLGGHLPYVFTEQGVAMLSGVLKSDTAVRISIQIMRAFVAFHDLQINSKSSFQFAPSLHPEFSVPLLSIFSPFPFCA